MERKQIVLLSGIEWKQILFFVSEVITDPSICMGLDLVGV